MAGRCLECLCPCFFQRRETTPSIELPLLRKVSKLTFPMREYSPNLQSSRQRRPLPEFKLQEEANKRRSTASCKVEEHEPTKPIQPIPVNLSNSVNNRILREKEQTNSKDDDKSFKSFKDSTSLHKSSSMKRSLKLLRFPQSLKHNSSERFYSVADGIQVAACSDPALTELVAKLYDWTAQLQPAPTILKQSDVIDLERIRKIALLEINTKVEEFDSFAEHHNLIYRNSELAMEVQLKDFPKIYEEKIYSIVCRFTVDCPLLAFFTLFNSSDCQSRLNSFTGYSLATKEPFLILQTEQISNQLTGRRQLQLLKFSEVVVEEVYGIEKRYVCEIDRDLRSHWSNTKDIFKRITRATRDGGLLQVQIYTETTMKFKNGVDEKAYFAHCHNKFAQFLLRRLHKKIK